MKSYSESSPSNKINKFADFFEKHSMEAESWISGLPAHQSSPIGASSKLIENIEVADFTEEIIGPNLAAQDLVAQNNDPPLDFSEPPLASSRCHDEARANETEGQHRLQHADSSMINSGSLSVVQDCNNNRSNAFSSYRNCDAFHFGGWANDGYENYEKIIDDNSDIDGDVFSGFVEDGCNAKRYREESIDSEDESSTTNRSSSRESDTDTSASEDSSSPTESYEDESSEDESPEDSIESFVTRIEAVQFPAGRKCCNSNEGLPLRHVDDTNARLTFCGSEWQRNAEPEANVTIANHASLKNELPFQLHPSQDCNHKENYNYMRHREMSSHPLHCMEKQVKLTQYMRKVLVDWLVRITYHYKLTGESLHLMVNILDRYTARRQTIQREQYQLIGVTSLLIAAKQLEVDIISINTCLMLCRHLYTKNQLLAVERHILKVLSFELHVPTSHNFLDYYIIHGNITGISLTGGNLQFLAIASDWRCDTPILRKVLCLARGLLDIGVTEYNFSQYLPSIAAEASLCVAVDLLNLPNYLFPVKSIKKMKEFDHTPCCVLPDENKSKLDRYDRVCLCAFALRSAVGYMRLSNLQSSLDSLIEQYSSD